MDSKSLAAETDATARRAGILSRSTLGAAVQHLQHAHGITAVDTAMDVLRESSRRNNITVQCLAAALLHSDDDSAYSADDQTTLQTEPPPNLSFSSRGHDERPEPTVVLRDFMQATIIRAGVAHGTVQIRDSVYRGLALAGHQGFDRKFTNFFSYVEGSGSACGHALEQAGQVLIADVLEAKEFTEAARAVVLDAGIRSVQSTPLLDESGEVWGMVSTHSPLPHNLPPDSVMRTIQQEANECARWLRWYSESVLPEVLMFVHAAALRAAQNGNGDGTSRRT